MNRRQYLTLATATATVGLIAGCSEIRRDGPKTPTPVTPEGPRTATPEREPGPDTGDPSVRYGISFDRVVNAVDDLGMDPTGMTPIDAALAGVLTNGTLVEFPAGTYFLRDSVEVAYVARWGVRGLGDAPTDVRFVSTPGEGKQLVKIDDGEGLLVENVAFDYSEVREGSLGLVLKARDGLRVQDVHFVGFNPNVEEGGVVNLSPQALSPTGRAVVDGLVRTGPTDIRPHRHLPGPANEPGIVWLGKRHRGTLVVRNSHLENGGENGIYASRTSGKVHVENSFFKNNNQASLRIGGSGSHVKNCRFVVDTENAHPDNENGFINPHCILWETGQRGLSGGRIEGCSFVYKSVPKTPLVAVWADGSAGAFTIENTRFTIDVPGVQAVRADDPRTPRLGRTAATPWDVTLTNVLVEGSGSGVVPIVQIDGRPNSTLDNCCLSVSNVTSAVRLTNSPGSSLRNINVSGRGKWLSGRQSDLVVQNVSYDPVCRSSSIVQLQSANESAS
jgi:hypothetical protein